MIGDHLGKWVIYKELGRGGMGRVYLAQEEIGGRQAALKILAAELAQDVGFLHRFQREIETLSQLSHPNIVRFYESGMENGLYFYAMEYVEGQSLEEILHEQHRLPWKEVLDIALQICPALKHVHDHGVIHRDLKPPNLLRTPTGQIKLMDFGIAKVFASSHLTATGGVVGTAEFLSPEQAAGKPVTKRSDLYSLGVVLYTLLTGRTPFEGTSFLDLLHKHRYGQFDRPAKVVMEIPYEIDEVVCQLLEKDPANRPADCLVLGRQLEGIRRKLERKSNPTEVGVERQGTVAEHKAGTGIDEGGPGPATLMSRLMREELEREKAGGPLHRMLNNIWVLVPLLLLVIGIIVWTFTRTEEEDPSRRKEEPSRPGLTVGEAERFYRQGERLRQEGKVAEARRVWQNVVVVFQGVDSEKEWVGRADRGIKEINDPAIDKERWAPVRAALKRAAALRDEGKLAEAERIWAGIEALYGADDGAQEIVRELQAARGKAK
ncbi:MAG TPA: serine/threonine-protein kinase [Gemmataceae bacterium]|nr:serine/threonine-protein kinase [Gemmataceae bacterium]